MFSCKISVATWCQDAAFLKNFHKTVLVHKEFFQVSNRDLSLKTLVNETNTATIDELTRFSALSQCLDCLVTVSYEGISEAYLGLLKTAFNKFYLVHS